VDRYAGKKAVIIGGTHGVGPAIVKALPDGGAEVLLTGNDERNADAARQELGRGAHAVRPDATDPSDIEALGRLVEEKLGQVDYVHVDGGLAQRLISVDR